MPRIARGLADNQIYHIINRGNNRQRIFHAPQDYDAFIKYMKEARERHPIKIYAYCLMPNHFHMILMTIQAGDLSKWMQWLMTSHVRRYHTKHKTSGHIWQGRFKSFIIQKDEHLVTALRYVENNPVRAGLVVQAKDWIWSSHRELGGFIKRFLTDEPPINLPKNWSNFVNKPLTDKELEKVRTSVVRQCPFGAYEWQMRMSNELGLRSTMNPRGRPKKDVEKK